MNRFLLGRRRFAFRFDGMASGYLNDALANSEYFRNGWFIPEMSAQCFARLINLGPNCGTH